MANCNVPDDWTVLPTGHGTGSVSCGDLRGWYTRNSHGLIQIDWTGAPEGGPSPDLHRAAIEACEQADGAQQTGKAGRNNVGG